MSVPALAKVESTKEGASPKSRGFPARDYWNAPSHDSDQESRVAETQERPANGPQWSLSGIKLDLSNDSGEAQETGLSPTVNQVLRTPGRPLDSATRGTMESRFGHDFSRVRIHHDEQAAASASRISANAYTVGSSIVFDHGRYQPHSPAGQRLLAHELAHVVQQSGIGSSGREQGSTNPLETETEAKYAASRFSQGAEKVSVACRAQLGVACDHKTPEELEEERRKHEHASMTSITQRPEDVKPLNLPVREINDPSKGKGVLNEATAPFALYAGWDWNHIGGGSETASSRTSLARRSSHDVRMGQDATAGTDFLVENVKTDRLVIGEQKATQGKEFTKATSITTSLESNIKNNIKVLQERVRSGSIKRPEEVARLQRTIERLQATQTALQQGRQPGHEVELPPGVVFELTNVGGKGEQIGKEHTDLLAKAYGNNPRFMEHLLSRTFVRDPALAKRTGRDQKGERGTDADPDIVPAKDILTPAAKDDLARRKAGKTERQWRAQKDKEQAAQKEAQRVAREQAKDAIKAQREANMEAAKERAAKIGEEARQRRLKELREEHAEQPKARTKRERDQAEKGLEREAKTAGRDAAEADLKKFKDARKKQDADERAARANDALAKENARKAQSAAETQARTQETKRAEQKKAAIKDAHEKAQKSGALETPASIKKLNENAIQEHTTAKREAVVGKAAHMANQAAGAIRAYDAYDDARAKGKGKLEAGLDAGATYLENTNPIVGAASMANQRMQKDEKGQQYYGDDAMDAWIGTIAETGAGYVVPGTSLDQAVNALSNVSGAVDDHMQRGRNPKDPKNDKANFRTATDLAADVTPSRMFAQTMGAGARAYYDIGKAIGGDTKGVDKFGEDAVRGKLGSVIQPWAMAADFVGNLGSDSAGVALDKTLKKTEGTTLRKVGDASGDAMYELGQSKEAKSGKYGTPVQGVSMMLGMTSDMIAGKSFDKALQEAADAGKGSLADTVGSAIGDAAFNTVEKGKELIDEDLPAAKKKALKLINQSKEKLSKWWKSI